MSHNCENQGNGWMKISLEKLWQPGEGSTDWKRGNMTPIFKKGKKETPRELQGGQSHLCALQNYGAISFLLETMLRHMENGEVICNNQHGFIKVKLCLTNLILFYDGITGVVDILPETVKSI